MYIYDSQIKIKKRPVTTRITVPRRKNESQIARTERKKRAPDTKKETAAEKRERERERNGNKSPRVGCNLAVYQVITVTLLTRAERARNALPLLERYSSCRTRAACT